MNSASEIPVFKAGLVLYRHAPTGLEFCLTQIRAKNPAEQDAVNFGLPKGTRRYWDADGKNWHDARDAATAQAQCAMLEPLEHTVKHEAGEELGIPNDAWHGTALRAVGVRDFTSRRGGSYPIAWYSMEATPALQARMDPNPIDAHAVGWFTLAAMRAMADTGSINRNYVALAEEVASFG